MAKTRLVIFTEASRNIGLGHLTRCITLCERLEKKGYVPKLVINGDYPLSASKYKIYSDNWLDDGILKKYLRQQIDVAIIDSYLADTTVYETIAKAVKLTVSIDDNNRLDYPKGIVINGNIYADALPYVKKTGSLYLLGGSYTMLREKFEKVPKKNMRKQIDNILITFGGEDVRNLTPKVVESLTIHFPQAKKTVIVGSGFQNAKQLLKEKDKRISYAIAPSTVHIHELMINTDIAISAGGQTLYELARTGTPTVAITVADNQEKNVKALSEKGIIVDSGKWNDHRIMQTMLSCIYALHPLKKREQMSKSGQQLIDGQGAQRIASQILSHYLKHNMTIRYALPSDEKQILDLSNNSTIRKLSFQSKQITKKEHSVWFHKKLSNNNCLFLVSVVSDSIVGQIRFDIKNKEAIISISIYPLYQGHKIGSKLFKKGIEILKLEHPSVRTLNALIKKENNTSQLFFERIGFKRGEDKQNKFIYNYELDNLNK